jgi:UDP-N-acetylmuramoyl-L-alanyl-D-glutamate--2,6-diaminopimelate ligase
MKRNFGDLARAAGVEPIRGTNTTVTSVASDSRKVAPRACFVAVPGFVTDGHEYIDRAVAAGAAAVIYEDPSYAPQIPESVACARVLDSRKACAAVSAAFWGEPSLDLTVVGVTGTNGKTTTVTLIDALMRGQGHLTGTLGTLGRVAAGAQAAMAHTTPDSVEFQTTLADMRDSGVTHVTMEVSSHALSLHRVWGTKFDVAAFTGASRDHLDFYPSFDEYVDAKIRLFTEYADLAKPQKELRAVVNADDPSAPRVLARAKCPVVTYGVDADGCDVRALEPSFSTGGARFEIAAFGDREPVELALVGRFNIYNALAAAAAGLVLGAPLREIVRDLASVATVPGRFETIDEGQDFTVVVDYAHTPDGLENVLSAARQITEGRLICAFGCGGDRDPGKRPMMGRAAAEHADRVVITSDNPRSEDPLEIIRQIQTGIEGAEVEVEPGRRRAIELAISLCRTGDCLVIAGKGHEDYQIFADRTIHFDDREEARRALRLRLGRDT